MNGDGTGDARAGRERSDGGTGTGDWPGRPDLTGTVAVVTGASRGVGRGIAVELGAAGATVYVTGRSVAGEPTTEGLPGTVDDTAAAVTARGGEGIAVRCDHTVDADVEALFDRVAAERGRLDLLVNCAWGGYEGHDETFDDPFWAPGQGMDRWSGMFDAGVRAAYAASRLAVPAMLEAGSGLLVNVSAGDGGRYRGSVAYDVAKTAVERTAKAMAHELRPDGVAALALQPGFTLTERVRAALDEADDDVPEEATDADGDEDPGADGPEAGDDGDDRLAGTHSPEFVGRAVVALAADSDVLARSGGVYRVADLARTYGFRDVDGTLPAPFELDTEPL